MLWISRMWLTPLEQLRGAFLPEGISNRSYINRNIIITNQGTHFMFLEPYPITPLLRPPHVSPPPPTKLHVPHLYHWMSAAAWCSSSDRRASAAPSMTGWQKRWTVSYASKIWQPLPFGQQAAHCPRSQRHAFCLHLCWTSPFHAPGFVS